MIAEHCTDIRPPAAGTALWRFGEFYDLPADADQASVVLAAQVLVDRMLRRFDHEVERGRSWRIDRVRLSLADGRLYCLTEHTGV